MARSGRLRDFIGKRAGGQRLIIPVNGEPGERLQASLSLAVHTYEYDRRSGFGAREDLDPRVIRR